MNQSTVSGTRLDPTSSRRATWALSAFPAIGCAATVVSAFAMFALASFVALFDLGDSASPGQPAYDYVQHHCPNSLIGFLTGYPAVLAACCVLVLAATGLGTLRRWTAAIVLLLAAAALPWIPGLFFVFHLVSLPPG